MSTQVESPMRGYPRNRLIEPPSAESVVTKSVTSRGHAIRYQDAGAGPAIVLLPGWTMSAADWRDAGYVEQLASAHRILAIDPLGNGVSDKPHDLDAYRWPDVGADVLAVLDGEGIDRAVLWGYSHGASFAALAAAEAPDRAAGLVLASGGDLTRERRRAPTIPAIDAAMFAGDFGPLWAEYDFSDEDRAHDMAVNDPTALGAMTIASWQWTGSISLERVTAPSLVYSGGADGPESDRRTAGALGVELVELDGLNHLEVYSRLDLVVPLVAGFMATHGI